MFQGRKPKPKTPTKSCQCMRSFGEEVGLERLERVHDVRDTPKSTGSKSG